jgi:hypothetical protein
VRKTVLALLLIASASLVMAEAMVWKVVSSRGLVSATVYNDLQACKKALRKYRRGSTCVAVPAKQD